jgi:hypothetical protein
MSRISLLHGNHASHEHHHRNRFASAALIAAFAVISAPVMSTVFADAAFAAVSVDNPEGGECGRGHEGGQNEGSPQASSVASGRTSVSHEPGGNDPLPFTVNPCQLHRLLFNQPVCLTVN